MEAKINLQQLARTLAKKKNLSQKEAETFLREFFDAIIQNVTIEKSVKVTGLGSFKLIEVLERESINVGTGERIIIPGHTKMSFSPDTSLKDLVNKPFADFQTVIINDGTDLDEMERLPEEEEQKETREPEAEKEAEIEPETEQEAEIEPEAEQEPEAKQEPEAEPEAETEPVSEPAPEEPQSEPEPLPEPVPEEPVSEPEPSPAPMLEGTEQEDDQYAFAPEKVRVMTVAEKWALAIGILLLCALSYYAGYCHLFDIPKTTVPHETTVPEATVAPEKTPEALPAEQPSEDTISSAPVVEEDTIAPPKQTESRREEAIRPTLVLGKRYQIVGVRKTHIMKPGDYLTKIALEEYGEREFAKYIIAYNHFSDPNNVPVGMEILLPELKPIE